MNKESQDLLAEFLMSDLIRIKKSKVALQKFTKMSERFPRFVKYLVDDFGKDLSLSSFTSKKLSFKYTLNQFKLRNGTVPVFLFEITKHEFYVFTPYALYYISESSGTSGIQNLANVSGIVLPYGVKSSNNSETTNLEELSRNISYNVKNDLHYIFDNDADKIRANFMFINMGKRAFNARLKF